MYDTLKPGGWVQFAEYATELKSDDNRYVLQTKNGGGIWIQYSRSPGQNISYSHISTGDVATRPTVRSANTSVSSMKLQTGPGELSTSRTKSKISPPKLALSRSPRKSRNYPGLLGPQMKS